MKMPLTAEERSELRAIGLDDSELEKSLIERQREITLAKKFYEKQHLIGFIEENYHRFITESLPAFLDKNRKILLCTVYDKKQKQTLDYYLNLRKPVVSESLHHDDTRNVKLLSDKIALQKNLTRQLDLKVHAFVTEQVKASDGPEPISAKLLPQPKVITTLKKQVLLGRIPLLLNSRYDKLAEPTAPYYAFLIKGVYRVLYNVLTSQDGLIRYEKTKNACTVTVPKASKANLQYTQIVLPVDTAEVSVRFGNMTAQKKQLPLRLLLKILGCNTEQYKQYVSRIHQEYNLAETKLIKYFLQVGSDNQSSSSINQMFLDALGVKNILAWAYTRRPEQVPSLKPEDPVTLEILTQYLAEKLLYQVPENEILDSDGRGLKEHSERKILILLQKVKQLILLENDVRNVRFNDHLADKKLVTYDDHLQMALTRAFSKWVEKLQVIAVKELSAIKRSRSLSALIRPDIVTKEIQKYLTQQTAANSPVESYTEALSALNNIELVALQRRVVSSLSKDALNLYYRSVTPMKIGRICCVDTPNSRAVGIAEKLALGAIVSHEVKNSDLKLLYKNVTTDRSDPNKSRYLISLNNMALGYSKIPLDKLMTRLNLLKRMHGIGVNVNKEEPYKIEVRTTAGRILKPFYVVENGRMRIDELSAEQLDKKSLADLINGQYLSFLDVQDEINSKVTTNKKNLQKETQYTLVSENLYLSYGSNYLLLCNNNAAHRTTLALRLLKQALGRPQRDLFYNNRNKQESLTEANYSLVQSPFEALYRDVLGVNAITAFYHGQNAEDAVYVNKTAIERSLFNYTITKRLASLCRYDETKNKYAHQGHNNSEALIDYDGTIRSGQHKKGSVILTLDSTDARTVDSHNCYLTENSTYSNKVVLEYSNAEAAKITYTFSKNHLLLTGDKFGTKTGLKGIVGYLYDEIDLPLSKSGVVPSVYFSSHIINSRMTIGPLLEMLLSKSAVLRGKPWTFRSLQSPEYLDYALTLTKNTLKKNNLDLDGYEVFYDSGIHEEVKIYCGPTKVFLLQQHAFEKYYARGKAGGYNYLTRQPAEGKKAQGGLRFGSMQTEACLEQSATNFLKDRMNIDLVTVNVCKQCRVITHQLKIQNQICHKCNSNLNIRQIELPYPFVLLTKILRASHIETKLELADLERADSSDMIDGSNQELQDLFSEDESEDEDDENETSELGLPVVEV